MASSGPGVVGGFQSANPLNLTSKALQFGLLATICLILPESRPHEREIVWRWFVDIVAVNLKVGADRWSKSDVGKRFLRCPPLAGSAKTAYECRAWRHGHSGFGSGWTTDQSSGLTRLSNEGLRYSLEDT